MYDSEKGCMVFKDSAQRAPWDNKCQQIVMKEYCSTEDGDFEKWKKDGERFLEEDFFDGASFPFLNDNRHELFDWIFISYVPPQTYGMTTPVCIQLMTSLLYVSYLRMEKKSSYVEDIKMALAHLRCDMKWDY